MACPHGGLKTGGGVVSGYIQWINNGLNPPDNAYDWYLNGNSTLIIQNNPFNDHPTTIRTSNIPEIVSLLSGLFIQVTNFNSLRIGSENPVIFKGIADVFSTCGKFDGFIKSTYSIVCLIPNPDDVSERFHIQTHIIRFITPVMVPMVSCGNPRIVDDDIAKAVVIGDDFDVDGPGLNGLGLSIVHDYYHCLVESPDVVGRQFYWERSMMLKGSPEPEHTLICADNAPEIQHLLSFMNITQVTLTGLCCVHEPNTNTLLVDVSGIAKYHGGLRNFSELFCVSPPLIPSPLDLMVKQYYNTSPTPTGADPDHDIGGRRFRFACSIIEFIDPPLFMRQWRPLNRRPGTIPPSFPSPEEHIEEDSATPEEHSNLELTNQGEQPDRKSHSFFQRFRKIPVQSLRRCFQRLN